MKPKLAWYENNTNITQPIINYLNEFFEVKIFGFPEDAEIDILEFKPDVIVFDYKMEKISGVDLFIKLQSKLKFTPFFYTIWAQDDSSRIKIVKAGVSDEAIIDKFMLGKSFATKIWEYYNKNTLHGK